MQVHNSGEIRLLPRNITNFIVFLSIKSRFLIQKPDAGANRTQRHPTRWLPRTNAIGSRYEMNTF